jgi:ADP-ribose pyrophosphatase
MKKIIPEDAILIPRHAQKVYQGSIFSVYQWPQTEFDGTIRIYEMIKRTDSAFVIGVKDEQIVVLKEEQPGRPVFLGLPGGKVDPDEDPASAAAREMTEETGYVFNHYRLISVVQTYEKMEWFVYLYLATDFREQIASQTGGGEKIEVGLMQFENFKEVAKDNPRMGGHFAAQFPNLEALLRAPTFQGIPVEYEA